MPTCPERARRIAKCGSLLSSVLPMAASRISSARCAGRSRHYRLHPRLSHRQRCTRWGQPEGGIHDAGPNPFHHCDNCLGRLALRSAHDRVRRDGPRHPDVKQLRPSGAVYVDTKHNGLNQPIMISSRIEAARVLPALLRHAWPPHQRAKPGRHHPRDGITGSSLLDEDESGTPRLLRSDALGRLVQVTEAATSLQTAPMPTGRPPAAHLSMAVLRLSYSYDALGNLLALNQPGASGETPRNRNFTYDALSRLSTSTNPETGRSVTACGRTAAALAAMTLMATCFTRRMLVGRSWRIITTR